MKGAEMKKQISGYIDITEPELEKIVGRFFRSKVFLEGWAKSLLDDTPKTYRFRIVNLIAPKKEK